MALLALTAVAGTTFDCQVAQRHFTVFAPDAAALAAHDGDPKSLYQLKADGAGFGESMTVSQVLDVLPDNLNISLEDGNGTPTNISIYQLDQDSGTARAAVAEDISPMSAKATIIELEGSCSFMPEAGKEAA